MKRTLFKNCGWLTLKRALGPKLGGLFVAESLKNLPFKIKRVYLIKTSQRRRHHGEHAHHRLKQALFCIQGSCKVDLFDGKNKKEISLKTTSRGLFIGPYIWHTLKDFSQDCLILVFASDYFDESDYIRNFQMFLGRLTPDNG